MSESTVEAIALITSIVFFVYVPDWKWHREHKMRVWAEKDPGSER